MSLWYSSVDDDADETTVAATVLELHLALRGGEERVVTAPLDVGPRFEMGTALPDQNGPGLHRLTVTDLGAETLGVGVATVAARALSFFVRPAAPHPSMASPRTR